MSVVYGGSGKTKWCPKWVTRNKSTCETDNWSGYINNSCCGSSFDEYLYALGYHAYQTGQLFLNSTEQNDCLTSMESSDSGVMGCGFEKFTGGASGCSDYTVNDVANNLGNGLKNLHQACKLLDSEGESDQACTACGRRWGELGKSSDNGIYLPEAQALVCKFAVLVTMTSNFVGNENLIREVYDCLAEHSLSIADDIGGLRETTGRWILITGLVAIIAVLVIAILILFKMRAKKSSMTKQSSMRGKDASIDFISIESRGLDIPSKEVYLATNNLSPLNFIGQGIAGKVYRGVLSSGHHVAVKHIINDGHAETFVREVTSLSHVRHPNLVALLGYCQKDDESFLIYELCHNGNLSQWLFGKEKFLSWIQRLEIAIDSARGLWFLHTYPEGCIVHRDIKPTNILLSSNFQAKVSDFGLSKVMDVGQSFVSSEVRGTYGYVDPEYRSDRHVKASGDVYSFAIVLLQILSGQRVINLNSNKPMPLDKMAKLLLRGGNVAEFADPKLNDEYSMEAFDLILKLALSCAGLKQQRPSMEQVVAKLEKALEISTQRKSSSTHPQFVQ